MAPSVTATRRSRRRRAPTRSGWWSRHGDLIKAILADALGMHLDAFQRIVVDPGSLSVVRYTPHRPFVVTMNSSASIRWRTSPQAAQAAKPRGSDAVVGGGAGPRGALAAALGSCHAGRSTVRPARALRAGTVGEPGHRTFFLQARAGSRSRRWPWRSSRCRSSASGWPSSSTS